MFMTKDEEKKKARPKAGRKKKEEAKAEEAPKAEQAVEKAAEQPKAESPAKEAAPKRRKKSAKKAPAKKAIVARGKRKESVARATISEGSGAIRINSHSLESIQNSYAREIIREPLQYVGPEAGTVDISVNVSGGGAMGQAQAARTAIANALARYFEQLNLKQKFNDIDRSLLIEDTRRVEAKKYRGPKARARFQKSYR